MVLKHHMGWGIALGLIPDLSNFKHGIIMDKKIGKLNLTIGWAQPYEMHAIRSLKHQQVG